MNYLNCESEERIRKSIKLKLLRGIDDLNLVEEYLDHLIKIEDHGVRTDIGNLLIRFKSIEMAWIQYRYRQGDENAIIHYRNLINRN